MAQTIDHTRRNIFKWRLFTSGLQVQHIQKSCTFIIQSPWMMQFGYISVG